MTLTPSLIACWMAATESELKQPAAAQTRYVMMCAPGAIPQTGPRCTPYSTADWTQSPPAVVVVCVPWPSESRGEHTLVVLLQNSFASAPVFAMYVFRNAYAPMSLLLQANGWPRCA